MSEGNKKGEKIIDLATKIILLTTAFLKLVETLISLRK